MENTMSDNELMDEISLKMFGKPADELSHSQYSICQKEVTIFLTERALEAQIDRT